MNLFEYMIEKYGYNEPILLSEIQYNNYSKPWINKELSNLCKLKKVIRFEQGVYYIPKNTALGPSKLNPRKVIEKKYISDVNGQKGYYSGATLLNILGLSTQVPNVIEIYTNEENSKIREVNIGASKVILRKARVYIDDSNANALSFLELMNYINASFIDDNRRKILEKYIIASNIKRSDISKYAASFPDKAMRTLVESEVIYSVAQ